MQPIIRGSMLPSMTPTCSRRKLSRLAIRCLREFQIGNRVTARKSTGISFVLSIGEMTLLLKEGDCERSHQRRDHSLMGVRQRGMCNAPGLAIRAADAVDSPAEERMA